MCGGIVSDSLQWLISSHTPVDLVDVTRWAEEQPLDRYHPLGPVPAANSFVEARNPQAPQPRQHHFIISRQSFRYRLEVGGNGFAAGPQVPVELICH